MAIESARRAPDGPSTMTAMVTPSACPVVPPGSGRLNIMMTKAKAAKTEMSGIMRPVRTRLTRRRAEYHAAAAPAYNTAHVDGLRYPSGICMWQHNAECSALTSLIVCRATIGPRTVGVETKDTTCLTARGG